MYAIFTLCAGTFWDSPGRPTIKCTSAISSLLNISAFLERETVVKKDADDVKKKGPHNPDHPRQVKACQSGFTSLEASDGWTASWQFRRCCC